MVGRPDEESARSGRAPSEPEYREVIGHFASGVTVITTSVKGVRYGTTANAVTSLSLEPPQLLVCMNRDSLTGRAIDRAGYFVVNILTDEQERLASHFATKSSGKFDDSVALHPDAIDGRPLLHGSLAHIECRVSEQVESGTHIIFIGLVEAAAAREGRPLTYYRGKFGKFQETRG
jgi:flavin reductase (DIM6/NTAB) family NADH-FMN oxidoreductase RutF